MKGVLLACVVAGCASSRERTEQERASVFVDVLAADFRTCGLTNEGQAVCWGRFTLVDLSDSYGRGCDYLDGRIQCHTFGGPDADDPPEDTVPPPPDRLTQIGLSRHSACGVDQGGHIVCWQGGVSAARLDTGASYVQVAPGGDVMHALRSDGVVDILFPSLAWATPPPGRTYRKIASGNAYGCGLASDDTIDCWGNGPRWVGAGAATPITSPEGEFTDVVASDGTHACGLRPDGSAECWSGEEVNPVFAPETCEGALCHVLGVRAGPFVQLAVGYTHNCGLTPDGEVQCWGAGAEYGDCAADDPELFYGQTDPEALVVHCGQSRAPPGPFERIAAGALHTCGLRPAGSIECWGAGEFRGDCRLDETTLRELLQCGQSVPP